jgi:23S rRNA (uridine2552-2'-O)-methyltransferase
VDINKISPIEDLNIVRKDFTDPNFKDDIIQIFQGEKIDLLLSDASINKSGNKFSDQARQVNLSYQILDLIDFLKFKGNMVIKLFQGADFDTFFKKMKQSFFNLRSLKPQSSYKKSNEIYLIGLKKK